jgi:hypothetical protein
MSGPIASAVVLPEPDDAPPPASPPNALKRRQSSVTEDSVKRARTNGDDAADESKAPVPKRRERGRERRLFGAVLGALSQNPTTAGQKRRSEIEKRQQAQRRQEDEESEQRKAERLARRKVQRWKEQKRFERQAVRRSVRLVICGRANMVQMKARHDNMLHLAHFLHTKTEPQLYYKPWEMSSEEEDRIDDQIAEARVAIQRELDEYEDRQEEEMRRERRQTPDESTYRGGASPLNGESQPTDPARRRSADNETLNGGGPHAQDEEMHDQHAEETPDQPAGPPHTEEPAMDTRSPELEANVDEPIKDADEEVVEAAEDTVIY